MEAKSRKTVNYHEGVTCIWVHVLNVQIRLSSWGFLSTWLLLLEPKYNWKRFFFFCFFLSTKHCSSQLRAFSGPRGREYKPVELLGGTAWVENAKKNNFHVFRMKACVISYLLLHQGWSLNRWHLCKAQHLDKTIRKKCSKHICYILIIIFLFFKVIKLYFSLHF